MTDQVVTSNSRADDRQAPGGSADHVWRFPRPRTATVVVLAIVAAVGFLVPMVVAERHYTSLAVDIGVLAIFASAVGFLARQCGLISFGHAAFYGGSAYIFAVLLDKTDISPTNAVLLALVGSTALAAVIGMLIVRVSGISFGILALAFAQLVYVVVLQNRGLAGGNDGVPVEFSDTAFGLRQDWYEDSALVWNLVWSVLVLLLIVLWAISRSRYGRLLVAIRENEERARFSGYGTYWPRVGAFTISGFIAGVAGVLMVLTNSFVSPENLSWHTSGSALVVAILGGVGAITGPAVGAFLFLYAQDWVSVLTDRFDLVVGVAVIAVVIFAPGGVLGLIHSLVARVKRHRSKDIS